MDTITIPTTRTRSTRTSILRRLALAGVALAALAATPLVLASPAHAAAKTKQVASAQAPAPDLAGDANGVVNLNSATENELQLLPGVGPSKAAAVVAYRKKYGAFKKVEDLGKVKGFSYKTLKKLKPYLALSGATTFKGKAKKSAGHGGAETADAAGAGEP